MNSYSRETLRGGHHQTANGPYGYSRGNRVLKAKRTTGPSAQALLALRHTRDLQREHDWLNSLPVYGWKPKRKRTRLAKPAFASERGYKHTFAEDPLGRQGMFVKVHS